MGDVVTYRKFRANTAAAAIAAASTISLTAPVAAQETYTIQRGDELGTIARRIEGVQVGWRDLCSMNSDVIDNCDLLEIGTVITLPNGASITNQRTNSAVNSGGDFSSENEISDSNLTESSNVSSTANDASSSSGTVVEADDPSDELMISAWMDQSSAPSSIFINAQDRIELINAGSPARAAIEVTTTVGDMYLLSFSNLGEHRAAVYIQDIGYGSAEAMVTFAVEFEATDGTTLISIRNFSENSTITLDEIQIQKL